MIEPTLADKLPGLLGLGGALAVVGGSVFAWMKKIPQNLGQFLLNRFTVRVTIRDTDPIFPSLLVYFHKKEYMKSCKRLLAQCADIEGESGWRSSSLNATRMKEGILFTRAPGRHLILYKGSWIFFDRTVDEKKGMVSRIVESITLRTLGRSDKIIRELIEEARTELENKASSYLDVRVSTSEGWVRIQGSRKRPLSSIILPAGVSEFLSTDLGNFLANSEFYYNTGTPYHRGYLLEGPPGSGKSSVVQALATHFDFPLYALDLKSVNSDDVLRSLFRSISKKSFVLIEDIDTVFLSESRNKNGEESKEETYRGVTLGGLLNVLDGVFAPDGLIVFMTTNHPEKLDSALIRPGRIDEKIHLGFATPSQAAALYRKFLSTNEGEEEFAEQTRDREISMAELQEQLVSRTLGSGK